MGEVVVEREIDCEADASAIWHAICDTERLNRAVGLGKVELHETDGEGSARYVVSTVSGGFPLQYEEEPFEWVENESFRVKRIVKKGLVNRIENIFHVREREGGGSAVKVRFVIDPKYGVLTPVVRMQASRFLDKILGEFKQVDRELAAGKSGGFSTKTARLDWTALERVAGALLEDVGEARKEIATKLIDFVSAAPDFDLDRIRPFELADQWGEDRREVLGICLHAVVAGLLELHWDIVCPSCRTASSRLKSLDELETHGACHLCDISFDLELDRAVEATFRPVRVIREVDAGPYCVGGPARTPHVFAQVVVPAGREVELHAPTHAGRYRLFVRGGAKASVDVSPDGSARADVAMDASSIEPSTLAIEPGGTIRVKSNDRKDRHIKLERVEWGSQAATAYTLSTLPEFRRMFAREVLRPGLTLSIARVALLFTDLTDSTKMYSVMGDARAFKVVQDHFGVLEKVIAEHDGVIVKTIGDAVMAAFAEESHAVRAAAEMHHRMRMWRQDHEDARTVRLKIGLFAGACYAVTANGILDYFGQTVNVAARLQGKSDGGEVVMQESLADEAMKKDWLCGAEVTERFEATLKGVDEHIRAARVLVDTGEAWQPIEEAKAAS